MKTLTLLEMRQDWERRAIPEWVPADDFGRQQVQAAYVAATSAVLTIMQTLIERQLDITGWAADLLEQCKQHAEQQQAQQLREVQGAPRA